MYVPFPVQGVLWAQGAQWRGEWRNRKGERSVDFPGLIETCRMLRKEGRAVYVSLVV